MLTKFRGKISEHKRKLVNIFVKFICQTINHFRSLLSLSQFIGLQINQNAIFLFIDETQANKSEE